MKKKLESEYAALNERQHQFEKEKQEFEMQQQRYMEERKAEKYVSVVSKNQQNCLLWHSFRDGLKDCFAV